MTEATPISKHRRVEWALLGLIVVLSFVVIEQQYLSRPIQVIVGNLVSLNDYLTQNLGAQDGNTLLAQAAHERLLNIANLVRRSLRLLEAVVLLAGVAFAVFGSMSLWVRLGLLIWVLGCVARPIFMVLH